MAARAARTRPTAATAVVRSRSCVSPPKRSSASRFPSMRADVRSRWGVANVGRGTCVAGPPVAPFRQRRRCPAGPLAVGQIADRHPRAEREGCRRCRGVWTYRCRSDKKSTHLATPDVIMRQIAGIVPPGTRSPRLPDRWAPPRATDRGHASARGAGVTAAPGCVAGWADAAAAAPASCVAGGSGAGCRGLGLDVGCCGAGVVRCGWLGGWGRVVGWVDAGVRGAGVVRCGWLWGWGRVVRCGWLGGWGRVVGWLGVGVPPPASRVTAATTLGPCRGLGGRRWARRWCRALRLSRGRGRGRVVVGWTPVRAAGVACCGWLGWVDAGGAACVVRRARWGLGGRCGGPCGPALRTVVAGRGGAGWTAGGGALGVGRGPGSTRSEFARGSVRSGPPRTCANVGFRGVGLAGFRCPRVGR